MSDDRQLLEAAAKAAGIKLECIADGVEPIFWIRRPGPHNRRDGDGECWSPLTDDGDALRLAVKLRIDLFNYGGPPIHDAPHVDAVHMDGASHGKASEDIGADPYAATRRAIVRAAAAMATEQT